MKKRIGNDFTVSWSITRIGQPESFEPDMPIKVLILNASYSWVKIEPTFHVIGNVISFVVPADKQQPGRYRIMLQYQKRDTPQNRTYTVDVCNAFELVSDSCNDEISEGDVSLNSDVKIYQDGKDGLNAYQLAVLLEGFDGTAEEYVSSIRQPSLDAAAEAVTATQDLRLLASSVTTQEDLREKEEALRKQSEAGRVDSEKNRVSVETLRSSAELERNRLEEIRKETEQLRNESERNRKISETNRADSEILRAESETNRVKKESNRVIAEAIRANAETLRTSSEQDRAGAETLRISAETKRGTDFTSFLTASAGQVKTEVDKIAPALILAGKATTDANTAALNASTQADYAKSQAESIALETFAKQLLVREIITSPKKLKIASIDYENCLITFTEPHECAIKQRFISVYSGYENLSSAIRSIPTGIAKDGFRVKEIIDEYSILVEGLHGNAISKIENLYPTEVNFNYFLMSQELPTAYSVTVPASVAGKNYDVDFSCQKNAYPLYAFGVQGSKFLGQNYNAPFSDLYWKAHFEFRGTNMMGTIDYAYYDYATKQVVVKTLRRSSEYAVQSSYRIQGYTLCDDLTIEIYKIS